MLTTAPVEAVLPTLGWRGVFWLLCAASLGTAAWIFLSVRDKPASAPRRSLSAEVAVIVQIVGSRRFWRYGPAAAMLSIMNFAYLGLWAGPWLRDVAGYDGVTRAHTLFFYTLSLMAGGWLVGLAGSRAQARGLPAIMLPTLCTAGLLAAQVGLALQPTHPAAVMTLWALFAFCAAGGPTAYIAVGQMFPVEQTARIATAINTLTLCGAFALQAAIGAILDLWPRNATGGWDASGYSVALAVSAAVQLAAALAAGLGSGRR